MRDGLTDHRSSDKFFAGANIRWEGKMLYCRATGATAMGFKVELKAHFYSAAKP
jgi:hypothetical protein